MRRGSEARQNMTSHSFGKFFFAKEDRPHSFVAQQLQLVLGVRTRSRIGLSLRAQRSRVSHDVGSGAVITSIAASAMCA
jgi:hypothetical protein